MIKPVDLLFPEAKKLKEQGKCPTCAQVLGPFRNESSIKEFGISGMCQECQDSIFGID